MNINKDEVKDFFEKHAPSWDSEQVDRSWVIDEILDIANWDNPIDVLDVACGTGLLFPYYLKRNIKSITGVDISSNMINIAKKKIANIDNKDKIKLICQDIEVAEFDSAFDLVVVYNAYPHFSNGDKLIEKLASIVKPCGRLIIAHGFSKDTINKHHSGSAKCVSKGLEDATVLADRFKNYFDVDTIVSDNEKYIVSGVCKKSK